MPPESTGSAPFIQLGSQSVVTPISQLSTRSIKENHEFIICDDGASKNIWEKCIVVSLIKDRYGFSEKIRGEDQEQSSNTTNIKAGLVLLIASYRG